MLPTLLHFQKFKRVGKGWNRATFSERLTMFAPPRFVVKRILKTVPNKVVKIPNTYSRAPPYTHRLPWLTPIRVLILNYYFLYLASF